LTGAAPKVFTNRGVPDALISVSAYAGEHARFAIYRSFFYAPAPMVDGLLSFGCLFNTIAFVSQGQS
jgi:hypothetical protein